MVEKMGDSTKRAKRARGLSPIFCRNYGSDVAMKGYQFLENDFFTLCQTREIGKTPMLPYLSQSTLSRSRAFLQKRGVIKYHSGKGTHPTEYTMLGTVLLPVVKKTTLPRQNAVHYRHFDDPLYTSKERLKKKVGIFKGMTNKDKEYLKSKGINISTLTKAVT
ncbi:MAG: hypothetical protein KJ983_04270 [Candidatus Omnitrophica bacterium]|nr:hypothetical protein [Candidatus Omnitrophota bacterium]